MIVKKTGKKAGVDYGFIDITQTNHFGEEHKSTLEWMKDKPGEVYVLGGIPHGNNIRITKKLLEELEKRCL